MGTGIGVGIAWAVGWQVDGRQQGSGEWREENEQGGEMDERLGERWERGGGRDFMQLGMSCLGEGGFFGELSTNLKQGQDRGGA